MAVETVHADAVVANSGCINPTDAVGAADGTFTGNTDNANWNCRWSITDPADPLTAGATHTVTVRVRKSDLLGNGDPSVSVDLYDNGTLVKSIIASTAVSGLTATDLSGTFTTAEVSSGANVQILVSAVGVGGSPAGRRNVQVDAITVEAETSAAAPITLAVAAVRETHAASTVLQDHRPSGSAPVKVTASASAAQNHHLSTVAGTAPSATGTVGQDQHPSATATVETSAQAALTVTGAGTLDVAATATVETSAQAGLSVTAPISGTASRRAATVGAVRQGHRAVARPSRISTVRARLTVPGGRPGPPNGSQDPPTPTSDYRRSIKFRGHPR